MAILQQWPDGYILDMDPRREDPLYYYRKEDDWSGAIGLEILPLYHDRDAEEVEISVFGEHRGRELALDDAERNRFYHRTLPALAARRDSWKRITLRGANLAGVLESGALSRELRRLGFDREEPAAADSAVWSRE